MVVDIDVDRWLIPLVVPEAHMGCLSSGSVCTTSASPPCLAAVLALCPAGQRPLLAPRWPFAALRLCRTPGVHTARL